MTCALRKNLDCLIGNIPLASSCEPAHNSVVITNCSMSFRGFATYQILMLVYSCVIFLSSFTLWTTHIRAAVYGILRFSTIMRKNKDCITANVLVSPKLDRLLFNGRYLS
jgi:hypothetical protein